jgi:hypothetical protein
VALEALELEQLDEAVAVRDLQEDDLDLLGVQVPDLARGGERGLALEATSRPSPST